MHNYVRWQCCIDYCVRLSLVDKILCYKLLSFNDFSLLYLGKFAT